MHCIWSVYFAIAIVHRIIAMVDFITIVHCNIAIGGLHYNWALHYCNCGSDCIKIVHCIIVMVDCIIAMVDRIALLQFGALHYCNGGLHWAVQVE